MVTIAVAGASGYAGGEILRILANHPNAEVTTVTAHSQVGSPLGSVHPHLGPLCDLPLEPTSFATLAQADVVYLALPHGASAALAEQLSADQLVIDCGADHRLVSGEDWTRFYGGDHPGTWTYGMPELVQSGEVKASRQRAELGSTRRIAVPGCNVTAVTLALAPGVAAGLLDTNDLVAVLACGTSGAGKALKPHLLSAEVLGSASPYAVGGTHRHIPEIQQNLRSAGAREVRISFTPTLVPMSRGILATCTARLNQGVDPAQLRSVWERTYGGEAFVTLLPEGEWPATASVLGSGAAHLQLAYDSEAQRAVVVSAIDNLGKGTASAAVQSMNLALGLGEGTGLTMIGVAP